MQITIIENVKELTAAEQKALYTEGADIYTGIYYLLADADLFTVHGKDIVPVVPALRSLSSTSNIKWVITNFRGNKVAFGSATV